MNCINLMKLLLPPMQTQSIVMFGVLWISVIIAIYLFGLLLCIWVYRDAQKRGMNGALWLIIVLLGNIVGLIIYLIVREPYSTFTSSYNTQYCKYCGNPVSPDAKFCPKCGKELK